MSLFTKQQIEAASAIQDEDEDDRATVQKASTDDEEQDAFTARRKPLPRNATHDQIRDRLNDLDAESKALEERLKPYAPYPRGKGDMR